MTDALSPAAKAGAAKARSAIPNKDAPEAAYDIARLVYGAADALVRADTWSRNPILAGEADGYRIAAREALRTALAKLETMQ